MYSHTIPLFGVIFKIILFHNKKIFITALQHSIWWKPSQITCSACWFLQAVGTGSVKSSIRSVTLNWVSYQSNRLSESNLLIGRLSSTNWDFLWLFTSHAWTSSQTHYLISSFIQTISNHTAEHIKSYHLIYALSCLLTLCKRNCYANQSSV